MIDNDTKRLSRLIAILTQLQSKRLVTSTSLAKKFNVSTRTIYRDMKALEQAGVPVFSEEGKGYCLTDGYRIPPVMFTENEANALITAEKLVLKNKDVSLIQDYTDAITKIKSVLKTSSKEKTELLSQRILVRPQIQYTDTSHFLSIIQTAITEYQLVNLVYQSGTKNELTNRVIEPFALYNNTQESWNLIAFCRLRQDFRLFRLDRILKFEPTGETFQPHTLTLEEYVDMQRKKFGTPDIPLSL
ncbi:MAG: YafY family transcriptional regulator [Bacteroidetes bacterium]|nr:YafY family transcriptional regulator [Bacteroidota bacterium]